MALIKCVECGSDISDKAEICLHCGCPIEDSIESKRKNKKRMVKKIVIPIISIIVLGCIVLASIVGIKIYNKKSGYYNDFKWGISATKLEKILKTERNTEKNYIVGETEEDYEGIKGMTAIPFYYWDDTEKYNYVSVLITNKGKEYSSNVAVEKFVKIYDKRYGENSAPNSYTYEWETNKTKIKMVHLIDNIITVDFTDKTNPRED